MNKPEPKFHVGQHVLNIQTKHDFIIVDRKYVCGVVTDLVTGKLGTYMGWAYKDCLEDAEIWDREKFLIPYNPPKFEDIMTVREEEVV